MRTMSSSIWTSTGGDDMIASWITQGAHIGLTAFIAVVVFALGCAAVIGLLAVLVQIIKGE